MHNKRSFAQEALLVFVGGVIGYWLALYGPKFGKLSGHASGGAATTLQRFEHYQKTHPYEVIAGAVMVGVILYLLYSRKGSGGKKR